MWGAIKIRLLPENWTSKRLEQLMRSKKMYIYAMGINLIILLNMLDTKSFINFHFKGILIWSLYSGWFAKLLLLVCDQIWLNTNTLVLGSRLRFGQRDGDRIGGGQTKRPAPTLGVRQHHGLHLLLGQPLAADDAHPPGAGAIEAATAWRRPAASAF